VSHTYAFLTLDQVHADIGRWAEATFGQDRDLNALCIHILKEVRELAQAIGMTKEQWDKAVSRLDDQKPLTGLTGNMEHAIEEIQDLHILGANMTMALARALGRSISSAQHLGQKMDVNRKRTWKKPDPTTGVVEHASDPREEASADPDLPDRPLEMRSFRYGGEFGHGEVKVGDTFILRSPFMNVGPFDTKVKIEALQLDPVKAVPHVCWRVIGSAMEPQWMLLDDFLKRVV
jgi:hypothetical protein